MKNALALKCISFLHLKWLFKCGLMACTKRVPLKSFAKVYCLWDISLSIDPLCGSQWKYERSDKPVHFKRGNICHIYQSNNTKRQKVRKICGYVQLFTKVYKIVEFIVQPKRSPVFSIFLWSNKLVPQSNLKSLQLLKLRHISD